MLRFAASPCFAGMAIVVAHAAPPGFCSVVPHGLPVDSMAAMYLLMSLFHLSPWLGLLSGTVCQGE
jgi:hypothetical protein